MQSFINNTVYPGRRTTESEVMQEKGYADSSRTPFHHVSPARGHMEQVWQGWSLSGVCLVALVHQLHISGLGSQTAQSDKMAQLWHIMRLFTLYFTLICLNTSPSLSHTLLQSSELLCVLKNESQIWNVIWSFNIPTHLSTVTCDVTVMLFVVAFIKTVVFAIPHSQ